MTNIEKMYNFLEEARDFFLSTVDGDTPRCRPIGFKSLYEGQFYTGIGDFKEVYRQLQANPKVEIVACKKDGHWLRYTGKAVFETDPKYAESSLEAMPHLRNIYNEETGNKLMMFHLEDATAVDIPMMGEGENLL